MSPTITPRALGMQGPMSTGSAPWYRVPQVSVISVEHPCIIKNVQEGLKTLGGDKEIGKIVKSAADADDGPSLNLSLHPEEPICKPLSAHPIATNNVLLKISVPRRIGRKRKRSASDACHEQMSSSYGAADGSQEPEACSPGPPDDSNYLLRSLHDNPTSYKVEVVGLANKAYRYRGLADFVYSTPDNSFVAKIRDTFLDLDYEKLKAFRFDPSKGSRPGTDLVPPPQSTGLPMPFNYTYLQNPAVKIHTDSATGASVVTNTQVPHKVVTIMLGHANPSVPTQAPPELPALASLHPLTQQTVRRLRELLEQRPLWTRRALSNQLAAGGAVLKYAWQYAGYMFRSGPWRDSLVRFGVDPRADPRYRVYQTLTFQLPAGGKDAQWRGERTRYRKFKRGRARNRTSHIFDGKSVCLDGKVWQVCDITDPLLKGLLATDNLRATCDIRYDGWYHNGTWGKARAIMKEKTKALLAGEPRSDVDFHRIIDFPDIINDDTRPLTALRGLAEPWEVELAAEIRLRATPAAQARAGVASPSPSDDDADDDDDDDQSSAESMSDESGFESDDSDDSDSDDDEEDEAEAEDGEDDYDDDDSSTMGSEWPDDSEPSSRNT